VARRNRVDPFGDLHAVDQRGLFTGNRGCLVDDRERVVRHHRGDLWITCLTAFRGRRVALARPQRWTPIFFLDDAVALAAGHRPCGECRVAAYRAYRDAVTAGLGRPAPLTAGELNARLRPERLRPGRGLDRAGDRQVWTARAADLPDGTVVVLDGDAHLLRAGEIHRFSFAGWGPPRPAPEGELTVLTPPTSTLALAHGFTPVLHPTAAPT
jgi:hypothetical protein